MLHSKRSSWRFMSMACLLGLGVVTGMHSGERRSSIGELVMQRSQSAPTCPSLIESAPTCTSLMMSRLRRSHSTRNLTTMEEWADITASLRNSEEAPTKFLMLDLDQAALHRNNGCGATETRTEGKGKPFVTYQEAVDRQRAFIAKYRNRYRTMVVSKLPVGKGYRKEPGEKEKTWLLVIFRPGLAELFKHCEERGWTIGVNTAMNPVHGQPIVDEMAKMFNVEIKTEHRFFRMSTVRDPKTGDKNIKDYDKPTWLVRLYFEKKKKSKSGKWFYQFKANSESEWTNLVLNDLALAQFCPDVREASRGKMCPAIQDNMLPTYLADALQFLLDPENKQYEQRMTEADSFLKSQAENYIYSERYRESDQYASFNYPYPRNIATPIWDNNLSEEHFISIHERLGGEKTCIVHFDDKDFDVRLPEGNCPSIPWYPENFKADEKKGKRVKSPAMYQEDLENLKLLLT